MGANFAYKNSRDIEFILQEWLPTEDIFSLPRFKDNYSKDDIKPILNTVRKIAKELYEPTYDDADNNPVQLIDGKVIIPPSYKALWDQMQAEGWGTSNFDPAEDAMILPEVLNAGCRELFQAANTDFNTYIGLAGKATSIIAGFGNERVKDIFLPNLLSGKWSGGMAITESNAGSDVGDLLSKAYPTDDPDIFLIKGQKQFITASGHPLTENHIHLYLARVDGAKPGTAGISLFVLPELWSQEDGTLEANDVEITGVEHKLGLRGQATCALSVGDNNKARAYLLGKNPLENDGKGDGMKIMFNMMNSARLGVGGQSTALAANAMYNARDYAHERVQGRNAQGERVPIIEHADIKRTLLHGKALIEACRAMNYKGNYYVDIIKHHPDPEVRKKADTALSMLTPLCKAYCSDEVWNLVADAMQIYGGYGVCEDYPVAHIARDCKVLSIYEGTNYIQSLDLIGRKMTMGKGEPFKDFLRDITDFIESNKSNPEFTKEFEIMGEAVNYYKRILKVIMKYLAVKNIEFISVFSRRVLTATAQLFAGRCILDQAILADKKTKELGKDHFDYNFYVGKVAAARYFVRNIIPNIGYVANVVEGEDTSVLDIPIEAFDY